jgi:predicted PurR-regulated permease PerM
MVAIRLSWPFISLLIQTLLPFVVGLIFAYVFDPFVTFAQRQLKISRIGGLVVLYGLFLMAVSGFIAIVLPILITQITSAWNGISVFVEQRLELLPQLRDLLERLQVWLMEHGYSVDAILSQAARSQGVQEAARTAATSGARAVGAVVEALVQLIGSTIGLVTFLVFAFLVNVYLLLEFSKLRQALEIIVPEANQQRTFAVLGKIDVAVGGFIRGTLITAFIVGVMTFLGLYALGLKQYALLIGIIAGFGNLIPYLGAVAGGAPALLYVIFSGQYESPREQLIYGGAVIGLTAVIQAVESLVLQPKIVGQSAQLHPVAVLLALAVGSNFGLLGMIVAVPAACIIRVLLKEFYWDRREEAWQARTGMKRLGEIPKSKPKKRKAAK